MARRPFGGGGDAIVLNASTGLRAPFLAGTAWTQRSGGSQITDLADLSGQPLTGLLTDALGAIAPFLGPGDGSDELWVDFGYGRYRLEATDLADRLETLEGGGGSAIGAGTVVAKGDLLAATGAGAVVRLPVGASGRVLTADPAASAGMSWQAPLLGGISSVDYTLTATGNVAIPAGIPQNGYILKVKALASGAGRDLVFDSAFILSTNFASRTFSIPSGKVFVGEAEYSSLAGGWVITQGTFTTTGAGGGGASSLSAGADQSLAAGNTFSRTATEPSGVSITSRAWTIVSGPTGEGTTIGTAAALSWVPGSTPGGSTDIRQPSAQEKAFEFTSTAENSTTDWTTAYDYIEDILDGRGYTAGLVGFTSATGDMLELVEYYSNLAPGNDLEAFLPGLEACAEFGDTVDEAEYGVDGAGASDIAEAELGQDFLDAWADAATNDPLFRQAQRDLRRSMYWEPALAAALADGVGALGLAIYYDTSVNHGHGVANSNDGSFTDIRSRTTGTKPINGGNQKTWLTNWKNVRSAVLTEWGDNPPDGRIAAITSLLAPASPNFNLTGTVNWNMYGEPFSFNEPSPPNDSTRGIYTLRYTATGAGSDDVTVTVT